MAAEDAPPRRPPDPRIIVALDFPEAAPAKSLCSALDPARCRVKIGKELFVAAGPAIVEHCQRQGFEVFLDLKFHDIPHTVAGACRAAARLGVWMVNVHASGGARMLGRAREALAHCAASPLLTAVTVLTSATREDLAQANVHSTVSAQVAHLARLARECALDGVVCSAHEVAALRTAMPEHFLRVTPGIRAAGDTAGDQRRIMTPGAAVEAGATHLVVGRSITAAPDPERALRRIDAEVARAGAGHALSSASQ